MANPLYLFFSSRAGIAGTVLRWTMAAFVLHLAVWQLLTLLGQPTWGEALLLPWIRQAHEVSWSSLYWILPLGLGLLVGLFTRICALVLLVLLLTGLSQTTPPSGAEIREVLFAACICLTLAIAGAGRFSLDRRIGEFFVPTF